MELRTADGLLTRSEPKDKWLLGPARYLVVYVLYLLSLEFRKLTD